MCQIRYCSGLTAITFVASLVSIGTVHAQERTEVPNHERNQVQNDPNRREWYSDDQGHLTRRYPRQFDTRQQFYRDGYGYRFGVPSFDQLRKEEVERAYQRGLVDGRAIERREIQAERGIGAYEHAMSTAQAVFEAGEYGIAARHFLLAATLNQGDPAARLGAAHAQTALHEYEPAARLVRRAFELQPRLVYLPMDIRGSYGDKKNFRNHLGALKEAVDRNANAVSLRFLLGYYYYYSDDMDRAAIEFEHAAELDPEDPLLRQLAQLAGLTAPGRRDHQGRPDASSEPDHP